MENEQRISKLYTLSCRAKSCVDVQPIGNLTLNEISSLIAIFTRQNEKEEQLTMSEAGELLGLCRSAMSQLVARLERKGMVRREIVMCDRRKTTIKLTAKTQSIIVQIKSGIEENLKKVIDILGEEKTDEFINLYEKYVEAVEGVSNA